MNKAEFGSSHVGVPAGTYLLTKEAAYTSGEIKITRTKPKDSRWQNSFTEIPQLLYDVMSQSLMNGCDQKVHNNTFFEFVK